MGTVTALKLKALLSLTECSIIAQKDSTAYSYDVKKPSSFMVVLDTLMIDVDKLCARDVFIIALSPVNPENSHSIVRCLFDRC